MAQERGTSHIPIEDFRADYHDPDEYLDQFEKAVELATNVSDAARKKALYKSWLPMKLDDATRMILSGCDQAADWDALKEEFKSVNIIKEHITQQHK